MVTSDLAKVLEDAPSGHWIALSRNRDRIVATSESLHDAIETARERGEADPLMMKVPEPYMLVL